MAAKTRIVQEHPERLKSQAALTDMGVPIDAAAERLFAVVEMKRPQLFQADDALEFLEGCLIVSGGEQRVTGGENVTRVEANTEPLRILDAVDNGRQLLKTMPQAASLSGGRLQQDHHACFAAATVSFIESLGDAANAAARVAVGRRSRMHDQIRQPEHLGTFDFMDKSLDRAAVQRLIRRGEIDQVRV